MEKFFPLHSSNRSLALPTGDFLLLGELPDGRTAHVPVRFLPGGEAEAPLTFRASRKAAERVVAGLRGLFRCAGLTFARVSGLGGP